MSDWMQYQRWDDARARLSDLLDPQTPKEQRLVEWLGTWDLEAIEGIAAMVERRVSASGVSGKI